jgi:hypothetical protein
MRCVQNPGAAKVYYEFPIPPNAGVNFYFRFHYEAPDETGRCAWIITGCAHPDNTNADCGNMSGNWAVVTTTATRTSGVTYIAQTNNQTLRKPDDTLCGATECRNTIFRAEVIVLSASMTHTTCDIRALEYVFDVTS